MKKNYIIKYSHPSSETILEVIGVDRDDCIKAIKEKFTDGKWEIVEEKER